MTRAKAISLSQILGQITLAAREIRSYNQHTLVKEIDEHKAQAVNIIAAEIEDPHKPQLIVVAYKIDGEPHPVLQVMLSHDGGKYAVSIPHRRSDPTYVDLLNACCGQPTWAHGFEPEPLI